MSYDPSLFTQQLPIETAEDREYRQWAEQLGASPQAVKEAVAQVGFSADAVRDFLSARGQA